MYIDFFMLCFAVGAGGNTVVGGELLFGICTDYYPNFAIWCGSLCYARLSGLTD